MQPMHIPSKLIATKKNVAYVSLILAAAFMLVVSLLANIAVASSIVKIESNIADVPGGAPLTLTVGMQNDGDVHELEIDHSLEDILPEFSVYANEANPYGGATCGPDSDVNCQDAFNAMGTSVNYSAASGEWTIDFGNQVTDVIRDNGGTINFYFVLKDDAGQVLWGSMFPPSADNSFNFDLEEGTGDSLAIEEQDEDEAVIPGVPNTSIIK